VIAPGERRDVILDLRHFAADEVNGFAQVFLVNVASVPFASNEESVASSTNGLVGLTPASILGTATTLEDAPFHPQLQAFPQVMRFDVNMQTAAQRRPNFLSIELPTLLIAARSAIKEFKYKNALGWQPRSGIDFGPNRIFLLDNQTFSMSVDNKSVGMMYLRECRRLPAKTPISDADLILPWDIDTDTLITPRSASLATEVHYQFDRRITKNPAQHAHSMHSDPAMNDTFEQQLITQAPKAGTYERWYFINLEAGDADQAGTPDMHPIHIHLVNFYLSRAWRVADTSGHGKPVTPSSPTKSVTPITNIGLYAKSGLRDTVRIAGNCIVELIVYFPSGYEQPSKPLPSAISRYPFHCHILEHEEMGMMRYFDTANFSS
jgi:FtsP/CotA-like multicopper oxidase with cupredoxin domain